MGSDLGDYRDCCLVAGTVVEQRSALLVGSRRSLGATSPGWNGNAERKEEEDGHDGEGKDPLQGDDLGQELMDAQRGSENAEPKTHSVVAIEVDNRHPLQEDGPDENVAKDTCNKAGGVGDHEGTVPEQGDEGPGKGARHDGRVDETSIRMVSVVQRAQVEVVENEDDLGPNEMGADKEHDEPEVEEVVKDEVAAHAGSGVDEGGVAGEEVGNVAALHDPKNDPVDLGDDRVEAEGGFPSGVLAPDGSSSVVAILWTVEGVPDRDDDGENPGHEGEDLVSRDAAVAMALLLGEGVVVIPVSHGDDESSNDMLYSEGENAREYRSRTAYT